MKKVIENREDLLRSLALRGDCHAFFSLSAPYLKARYQRERSTGALHEDAQTSVLAEATELLEKLQHVAPGRLDAWFEEHCMMIAPSQEDSQQEIATDKKIAVETAAFLNRCSRELMRSGSQLKYAERQRARRFPHMLLGNRIIVILLAITGAVGLFFAGALLMARFQASVSVSFQLADRQFSFKIPPGVPQKEDSDSVILALTAAAPQKPDSGTQQSISDTAPTVNKPVPPPRPTPSEVATAPAEKRALPPVVPKARMILPPMPTQPADPTAQPSPTGINEPSGIQPTPPPPPPPPSLPAETGPSN